MGNSTHTAFDEFVGTIAALRAPDGCPWDREQTHLSIAPNMIEEAYEAVDAIERNDVEHLREELGDVLLQVVLQSQIAAEDGEFSIDDVCTDVNAKIIRRHPHVFGDVQAGNASEVLAVWDKIKLAEKESEKGGQEAFKSLLDSTPASLPALTQAQKISRKAASAGFEWESLEGVWAKVDEEIAELKSAYADAPKDASGKVQASAEGADEVAMEFGDVLFSLVNIARHMGIDSENALRATCRKFRERWEYMERAARAQGKSLEGMPMAEMETLWQQAKG